MFTRIRSACRTLFRGGALDRELDEELRAFVEERAASYERRGLTPREARRAALVETGGVEQVKERVRSARIGSALDTTWRDVRYACRVIARSPGFAAVVVLTLALVIGVNATVFGVMRAVLWRDLPYPHAERLVIVDADARGFPRAGLADAEAADLRAETALFDRLASILRVNASVSIDGAMELVAAASATDGALEMLGALPLAYGRLPDHARDFGSDGYVRAVVISHDLWRRRLGASPAAIGRRIEINNLPMEVVGVLREDFRLYLPASTALPESPDVWFPRPFEPNRRVRLPGTLARLSPGVSLDLARTRLEALSRRFVADHGGDYPGGQFLMSVRPLHDAITEDVRPAMRALAAAVAFVLLIGCVNVGNLMLARGQVRAPELALRQALGAGRGRLLRQLFTEIVVLALAGGAGGLLLAHAGVSLIDWLRPAHLPRESEIAVDGAVVAFTAALSIGVSLLFSLLPALTRRRADADALRGGRGGMQGGGVRRLQRGLVIAEVGLCIAPLVAGGLMLHTFVRLVHAPLGFDPDRVLTAKMEVSLRVFDTPERRLELVSTAIDRVAGLPGVRAVSAAGPLPFEPPFLRSYGRGDGSGLLPARATVQVVFPGYLTLTGVRLRAGRDFNRDDLVARRTVAIVDERIAHQLWPGEEAIGRTLALGAGPRSTAFEVVGVTAPVRALRVRDSSTPHVFVPYDQFGMRMALVIDTDVPAAAIGPDIKRTVEALGTRRPVHDILPLRSYVDRSMGDTRFTMLVLVAFAAASLLLTGVGIYGTLAYLTSRRRRELAVRMALGATTGRVLRLVAGEGLALTAIGAALGMAGASLCGVWLRDLLYEVAPFDPLTHTAVAAAVSIVAVAAIAHPAARAARTDPACVLRSE